MATYFHGGQEIQPDGLQTLYLMNPSYVAGYSDAPAAQQSNMVFLNSPLNSLNSIPQQQPQQQQQQHQHQHQHQQQQHFVGIPLQPPSNEPNRPLQPMQAPSVQYNLWAPAPPTNANPIDIQSQLGPRRPGLSLSLAQFAAASGGEEAKIAGACSSSSNGPGLQSVLMGTRYLKAAQQLLDEVVSVGRGVAAATKAEDPSSKMAMKSVKDLDGDDDGNGKKAAELSTAERQELQMKKAKLVNMLDEVEQRYRQYHHQMQVVVSSFEAVAGFGSAKTYTALALQTISKQFRCLRDAISRQIRATSRGLGEEECMVGGGSKSVGSRLRFVDHHLRQQRALQQLGMIHHNAWRPQRGLPERAVSVLRAWLFEHFLHPYPKDSDKHMLAKQTGLTRSQVSNWFINARVRLWKPMVEEMYLEETKAQEQNNGGDDKTSKSEASEHSASKSTSQQANSSTPSRTEQTDNKPPMAVVPSSDLAMFQNHNDEAAIMQQRLKKQRSNESLHHNTMAASQMGMEMKPDELSNRELLMKFMDQGAGFGDYPIGEIGRFDHGQFAPRYAGNGVSLTLGLPHCETLSLSGSQQANYLSNESMHLGRRLELSSEENNYFSLSNNNANNPSASNAYESINNIQNRKRFAAQLLPDFVA